MRAIPDVKFKQDWHRRRGLPGRDFDVDVSAEELARLRDKPVAQMVSETLTELDRWAADTSFAASS